MKILFVCRGNVGRSQMAETIFLNLAGGAHAAASAGTQVLNPKTGKNNENQKLEDLPTAVYILESLKEIGIDASKNVRNQLTPEMVDWADKVVVMAEPETIPEYLKSSDKFIYWEIEDLFEKPLELNREIRDEIKSLVENLIGGL